MIERALSPRELEIARFAASGLTSREIGERLVISPRTVETHIAKVYEKLEIGSRVQLAMHVASHLRTSDLPHSVCAADSKYVPQSRPRHNLPRTLTSFVRRESEVAELGTLMDRHRLVTIVGAGGAGKTRIALEATARALSRHDDGVWFVEFAPIAIASYLTSAVSKVLGVDDASGLDGLVGALQRKRMLLVLDNCEHLVADVAELAANLLKWCPDIRLLATSRQRLDITGEANFYLAPLGVPDAVRNDVLSPAEATRYPAIALFAERAMAVDRRFVLTSQNVAAVGQICRRLDGLPLAIELAAAALKSLSPRQLLERLDERFYVLTGGGRDRLPRQQTLRALIDWSHDLLDDRERTFFRNLGIFVNGFTIEGAIAVGSAGTLDEFEAFDVLASLVEKSLVLAEPDGDGLRYRLLESTRAYATERLVEAGEDARLAGLHLRYLRDRFAKLRERQEATARAGEMIAAFSAEIEDLRFALDGALARPDRVAGAELLAALERVWLNGFNVEGIARHEVFVAVLPDEEAPLLANLWSTLSALLSDYSVAARAREAATKACSYARTSGDRTTLARALCSYAWACMHRQEFDDAERALTEAVGITGISIRLRSALVDARANLWRLSGNLDRAVDAFEQLVRDHRARGNARNVHIQTQNLASIEHERGNSARAIVLIREILPAMRIGPDRSLLTLVLVAFAGYLVANEEIAQGSEAACEAIATLAPREPASIFVTYAIETLALVRALRGDVSRAALLHAYADAAVAILGKTLEYTERTTRERVVSLLDAKMSLADRARLTAEGAALAPEAAIALALEVRTLA